ncbi:hypothetical protein M501DRAFT_1022519 [Patellaria atrata CBS 101060]|uniref:AAA+ ATPase domain-containing protein n=1 Tax=Patellaria atrata CBS 101060 TaxID=1346257 RepID=A0A9P4VT00_9PEZI|nr:hypothetical protein M501DRAFT_1022519 [Patellaria atrata CBS 101060]
MLKMRQDVLWRDDEVFFEDLGSDTYKEKGGFQKIEFCAKQAAQDQLQYFWRSKAINSMFHWYRNATKCYVYLSDVSVSTTKEIPQQSTWEASFRKSEWFTRGWTLQELIAPVSVEFFSNEGRRIGDKISLKQLVCDITSVPLKAISGCPLDEFTISERMEWAKNRKTTEKEDNIYCLLGILDISMQTSYGEGKEKALRRLQIEVEAATSAPSIIPFSRNDHFVGRESQLAELEANLLRDKQATILAIVGPEGVGKSQLALELAYKIRETNKNYSIFWIDASDIDRLYQSYVSIAQKLDIPGWDDENADIKQLVKFQLSRKGARQCLLIFDNTEDIILGSSGFSTARATNLIDYLPRSELCSIIFITINKNYLNTPVSRKLLYLPLGIVQAAAYINTRNTTLQEYRSQLVKRKKEALERDSELSKDKLQEYGIKSSIATTLLISMDQIRRSDTLAADYLFLATCVDRKEIPLGFLEASLPREREDVIKVLSSYALIIRRPAESALDLHQLVHRTLREWLRKQEKLDQWTRNAIKQLLRVFPDLNHGNRSKWRRLLPHVKYALSHSLVEQEIGNRSTLAWKYAITLYIIVQAMAMRKRVLGEEHPDTLTSMANLASTYRNQGRWKEAEKLDVEVMETRKRVLEAL